jgi:hypothetical protein
MTPGSKQFGLPKYLGELITTCGHIEGGTSMIPSSKIVSAWTNISKNCLLLVVTEGSLYDLQYTMSHPS